MPPADSGEQRRTRQAARIEPRTAPSSRTAISAYSEQVGWKRQWPPTTPLNVKRYARIRASSANLTGAPATQSHDRPDLSVVPKCLERKAHGVSSLGHEVGCDPVGCLRQAESSSRPLVLRRARIFRPARVRIRTRKPWVFFRLRLFG